MLGFPNRIQVIGLKTYQTILYRSVCEDLTYVSPFCDRHLGWWKSNSTTRNPVGTSGQTTTPACS